jgi:hypothetical protein
MRRRLVPLVLIALAALAQKSDMNYLTKAVHENHPALALANDRLQLTILPNGGAMVNLVLVDDPDKMNPLWDPIRMAREARAKSEFGTSLGHFVCVDGFGPVSDEEQAAGLPGHGEAHEAPWEVKFSGKEGNTATVTLAAKLPLVHENFTRTLRMVDGENVVYVQSELESLLAFDRPVNWAEHATIGAPFLERGVTAVDMPVRRAKTRPYAASEKEGGLEHRLPSDKEFTWPMAPALKGGRVDVRTAPPNSNSGDHTTCLMDPSRKLAFVTALHPARRLLLGYIFRREEYPWVQSWEFYPADGRLARGLEFGTQPFDVMRREAIQLNSMFDAPTYRWLPAKSKIETKFLLFYARTPEGMKKIDDARLEGGHILIEDRKAGKQMSLTASLPL